MYKELRPAAGESTASTPEFWATNFARSGRLTPWRRFRMRLSGELPVFLRHLRRGGQVLDAGCGFGEWVMLLRARGFRAEGLDYSPELVDRLRREYSDVAWTPSDIRHMPFGDESFDGVISLGVVEHEEAGPQAALREIRRVLRPGGTAIITVPRDFPLHRQSSTLQFPPRPGGAFFQYFMTEDELAAFLREAGLDPVATGTLRSPSLMLLAPRAAMRLPSKIQALLALLVSVLFRWTDRYDGMIYCVGRR
jgi:SAM-dependent methyltransferase